jgi:hypothetical protein
LILSAAERDEHPAEPALDSQEVRQILQQNPQRFGAEAKSLPKEPSDEPTVIRVNYAEKFGGQRGELSFDYCNVSIPPHHKLGQVEKPVHRLLDPRDTSVTLATLSKASRALGVNLVHVG